MRKTFRIFKWSGKKAVVLFVLTVVLVVAAVDTTLAFLAVRTDSIENRYPTPQIEVRIEENMITNAGDMPVYVRAATVATWVSTTDEKTILSEAPVVGEDYNYTLTYGEGWFKATDGFYYYSSPVDGGDSVEFLAGATHNNRIAGYELVITVVSAAIQATPAEAINESWPAVSVTADGTLSAN
jgi:hypothetical protein